MILSDRDIKNALNNGQITIESLNRDDIQPCSVDLHMGDTFVVAGNNETIKADYITLEPGAFVLATTKEYIKLGDDILGRLEGKSSIARLGLIIHTTAGFIDPGFEGEITLEMVNLSNKEITIDAGSPIAQICFEQLSSPCDRPYGSEGLGSHYQGQRGATKSYMI